ncbi:hypothetical protein NQ317_014006 [Molorchus minor]|uniref:Uncharacterized protein n=1 Tax=Molorchus minor TaxID=1323400 RepID=A0ABQ9J3K3_9CUCU|nr:hypothetical protein NQ317_014006 [Molorchus minor]
MRQRSYQSARVANNELPQTLDGSGQSNNDDLSFDFIRTLPMGSAATNEMVNDGVFDHDRDGTLKYVGDMLDMNLGHVFESCRWRQPCLHRRGYNDNRKQKNNIRDIFSYATLEKNRQPFVEICQILAEQEQLRATVSGAAKGALIAGCSAFVGTVLGGPLGMGIVSCLKLYEYAELKDRAELNSVEYS